MPKGAAFGPWPGTGGSSGGGALGVANWPVANPRIYAVDGTNGNDTNLGFADAASASVVDVKAATVLAGTRALKTVGQLAKIFPTIGANRKVVIVINAGTYTDDLALVLGVVAGYAGDCPIVRGTGTNTTAGCVAFDGSTNDLVYLGGATAPGLNVAGYNPTAGATTTSIPCQKAGGGAASLPVEPAQPNGLSIRFDANTATVALRNARAGIVGTSGDDVLLPLSNPLPAVPGLTDVFYIEAPGIVLPISNMASGVNTSASISPQLLGLRTTAGNTQLFGLWAPQFCWFHALNNERVAQSNISNLFGFYVYVDGSFPFVGATLRVDSAPQFDLNNTLYEGSSNTLVATLSTPIIIRDTQGFEFDDGAIMSPKVSVANMRPVEAFAGAMFGAAAFQRTSRIIGLGAGQTSTMTTYKSCWGRLGFIAYTQAGAHPAISIVGQCFLIMDSGSTGSTGNTDVGLDLTGAQGCVIALASQPTVTGTLGDVRLAGGQIVSWASLFATGVVDSAGNRIIGGTSPLTVTKFSGTLTAGGVATTSYLSDNGPFATGEGNQTPLRYPTSARLARRLRVTCINTALGHTATVTLFQNAVATAMQVSIPSGTANFTKFVDSAHPILFADGDDFDLRIDDPADAGTIQVSAVLEWSN